MNNVSSNENFCVKYFNSFVHEGPHGSHVCVVYEYLGVTLSDFLKNLNFKQLPLACIKMIT